jgi:hypothetical protein
MWHKLGAAFRWLGLRLLVASAVWAVLYVALNWHLTSQRDRALAWFTANGLPTSPQDISQEEVEPKDDAGPLWRAAAELLLAESTTDDDEELMQAQLENGKLVSTIKEDIEAEERPLTADEQQKLRKLLAKKQPLFDLLRRGGERPAYKSTIDYTQGIKTALPNVWPSMHLSQMVRLAAEVEVFDGKLDAAIDYWTTLRALQRWNDDEPILVCQLVATTQESLLTDSLQQGLRSAAFDDKQLGQMAALLQPVRDYREQVRTGMKGEFACFFNVSFGQIYEGQFAYVPGGQSGGASGLTRLLLLADQAVGLDYYRRLFESLKGDFLPSQVPEIDRADAPWYAIMTRMMTTAESNFAASFARTEAGRRVTAWGVALRRQKLATGAYPEKLADVRPGFAKAAGDSTDPFTAGPLVYRRQGEGFILYSVGANLIDDGGRNERNQIPLGTADDIAFAMEK